MVGATIDKLGVFRLAAPAMDGVVTVVVTASGDARPTDSDTVDHDEVSHTHTITVAAPPCRPPWGT